MSAEIQTRQATMAGSPRTGRSRARSGRELVLQHAARLFREKGYSGTSIRDIAKRVRMEPSAIYYHFASKDALLEEVLERCMDNLLAEVRDSLATLPADASSRERFRVAVAAHLRAIRQHGDFTLASRRVLGEVPLQIQRKHESLRESYGDHWAALFQHGAQSGEVRETAQLGLARMFLLGALNWTSEWYDDERKSPDQLAEVFCEFLFDGIGMQRRSAGKRLQ